MNSSTEPPLVSVVLPTYNRPEYLPEAIETVKEQTYENIELIVVDDHSSESPRDIVENTSSTGLKRLTFCRHEENKGVSAARNTGIKQADGALIALLDDDDLWTSDKIERQVDIFQREGDDVGVVCSGMRSVGADESTITVSNVQFTGDITKELLCGEIVPLPSVVVRDNVLSEAGLFDERLRAYEDQEWLIRLARNGEFRSVSEPLVISRRGSDHEQLTEDIEMKAEESYPLFMEKCLPIATDYGRVFTQKMKGHQHFYLGYTSLAHGDYKRARKRLAKAVFMWPIVFEFYVYLSLALVGKRGYMTARNVKRRIAHYRHDMI